jgi:hypothetical protein
MSRELRDIDSRLPADWSLPATTRIVNEPPTRVNLPS